MKKYLIIGLLMAVSLFFTTGRVHANLESSPGATITRIYVELETFQLLAFSGDQFVRRYPISTGKDSSPTPTGEFTIINKLKNPWYTPASRPAKAPSDPNNPIGTRWMGIDKPSYGIHGTIEPEKIQMPASRGCIRMLNEDVEELYEMVQIGTRVIVQEQFAPETVMRLAGYLKELEISERN